MVFWTQISMVFGSFFGFEAKTSILQSSAPACTGAQLLRFRGIWNQQKKSTKNRCKIRAKEWYMSSPADFQKHEKSQKICLKTPVKSSCIFNANFNDFCLHFGSQNPSKKQSPLNFFSTSSPRHVQDAPRRLQDTSKMPLRPSKKPPRRF